MVLEVTARDPEGQELFRAARFYMVQATDARSNHMVLGPDKKLAIIRDTSIQPFCPQRRNFRDPATGRRQECRPGSEPELPAATG